MPVIQILGNPTNPLHYLSCCGIFEIVARHDRQATAYWHCEAPVALCIDTTLTEVLIACCLRDSCRDASCWQSVQMAGGEAVYRVDTRFNLDGASVSIALDWWQETLDQKGEIKHKSAWKMYAGQQTAQKIISDMNNECAAISAALPEPITVTSLLAANKGMTGRFGFDPRSSRSALDVGFSPNDIGQPVATYPFAELLATIGIHTFFPARCGSAGRLSSSRGWPGSKQKPASAFQYRLWTEPLPLPLARAAATSPSLCSAITLASLRATRKNYSNLTMARPA